MKTIDARELPAPLLEWLTLPSDVQEPLGVVVDGEMTGTLVFEPTDDDPPIDVNASPRLQEILRASWESYKRDGGIGIDEVRRRLREWEAEEAARERNQPSDSGAA